MKYGSKIVYVLAKGDTETVPDFSSCAHLRLVHTPSCLVVISDTALGKSTIQDYIKKRFMELKTHAASGVLH